VASLDPRPYRFALVCAVLLATWLLLGRGEPSPTGDARAAKPVIPAASDSPALALSTPPNPRSFLTAFLRYEVADPSPTISRRLRAAATPDFAAALLARPPAAPPRPLPPAHIARLDITLLSRRPPRALITGTALRRSRPEPFAFLFEARHGRWLATGPAE
jgi:hypothetical protein